MESLNGVQKASVLLLSLDTETAIQVLRNLDENEIQAVTKAMAQLDAVSRRKIEDVLQEAKEKLNDVGLLSEGKKFIKDVVSKALGEKKSEEIGEVLKAFGPGNKPINFDSKMLATLIQDEHPQVVALIISCLGPKEAKEIISELPQEFRAEVVYRIAHMERIPPEVIEEVQETLRKKVANSSALETRQRGGVKKIIEFAKILDFKTLEQILFELKSIDPELAKEIESHLFTFDDLINLDDRSIQILLREIDTKDLVLSLKTAKEDLKSLFLKNLSQRAREMLLEDMEVMGPVRLKDIEAAQQRIVNVAKKLEEEGKIILKRGEEDVFV